MVQPVFTEQELKDLEEFLLTLYDEDVQEVTGIEDDELDAIYDKVYKANHF